MRDIDEKVLIAQKDDIYLETFLKEHEVFILHTAHRISGKYISKNDDQWSVSLSAFYEAVKAYSFEKGSFYHFAETVIKRRIYDYMRKQYKFNCEVPIDSFSLENDPEEEDLVKYEVVSKLVQNHKDDSKYEIDAITQTLQEYGFSFFDLVSVSPKAKKTRTVCAKAIVYLSRNPILIEEMRRTRSLPLKVIEKNLKLPRKLLERHRKYIIAGVEIIYGDYPILAAYLNFVREEMSK